jgi:hypothetical protein
MTGQEWDDLSEWAVKEREKLGYSTHRILRREGNLYRAYTESMLEHYEEAGAATRVMFIDVKAYGKNGGNYAPTMAYGMDPNPIASKKGTLLPKPIPPRPVLPMVGMLTAMLSDSISNYIVNPYLLDVDRENGVRRYNGYTTGSGSIFDSGLKTNNYKAYDRISGSLYD